VVIDPTTEQQPALAKAAEFAGKIDADLALFTCIFNSDIAHVQWAIGQNLDHLRTAALDEQFHVLEQLAEPLRAAGRSVSIRVAWDSPLHEAIVREALELEADFVIKDTHHHSALSKAFLTNTDWHLIRDCPCPLWLVKPTARPEHATIMAAVDPTHEDDQDASLDHRIVQMAQLFGAMFADRVQLVHVFEPPAPLVTGAFTPAAPTPPALDSGLIEQARAIHENALQSLAADGGFPAEQVHLREGNQVKVLPATAGELNADIVVMGAVARSRLKRVIVGHTAEQTLDRFPCDVVIVKPDDFESPVEPIPPIYGYVEKSG